MRMIAILSTALLLIGCDLHRPLGNDLMVQPSSPLPGAGGFTLQPYSEFAERFS